MLKVNLSKVHNIKNMYKPLNDKVISINSMIDNKTGLGNDYLGWTTYANDITNADIKKITTAAERIKENCDVLVVVGIGGSYLGAKAAIDAINGIVNKSKCEIIFLGNTLSPTYTAQVIKYISGKKIGINVISKSGTTLEPAIAFRLVVEEAKKSWGPKRYAKYVIATTDAKKGALHQMAFAEGFEEFTIPDDVGGRYSVFTPVGLLPMAVAGLDIARFIDGVRQGIFEYSNPNYEGNEAYKYALSRYLLKRSGNQVEFLITYEPHLCGLSEWWKQLFGESEGKENTGLLPDSLCFTTDLHSMGQFCQEGSSIFFETTIALGKYQDDISIPKTLINLDNLNYLANKPLSYVNDVAIQSTIEAHYQEGNRSNILIEIDEMNEFNLGQLMFFFCKACAMSAYLLNLNPFNQPGVEVYKSRMKEILKNDK